MLLLLLACTKPPTVTITSPEDGSVLLEGSTVTFEATLSDEKSAPGDLVLRWSRGTTLLSGESSTEGGATSLVVAGQLPLGEVEVALTATDGDGLVGRDSVHLTIEANHSPTVSFTAPTFGAVVPAGVPMTVGVQVGDEDETDLSLLTLAWTGLPGGPEHPAADGSAEATVVPTVGEMSVAVTVSDSQAGFATATLQWTAVDADLDKDGFVDATAGGDDCDDGNPDIHPGMPESCDGIDQNCDGATDENPVDAPFWYRDNDGDGYGAGSSQSACGQPAGWVDNNNDCEDNNAEVRPGAAEACDGIDNNCDGVTPSDESTDADADGFLLCEDCNDANNSVHPGASEVCDAGNVDENCNGLSDDKDMGTTGQTTWYRDADGDGYGTSSPTTTACDTPPGYAAVNGDCDDVSSKSYPGNTEICEDGRDNDCDGEDPRCRPTGIASLSTADAHFDGVAANDLSGNSVATADVDGDGSSEVVIGAWGVNSAAGAAYIVTGSSASLSKALATWTGVSASDSAGFSVAGVGDTNGDGTDDVLVGAFSVDVSYNNMGSAYLLTNPTTGGSLANASATLTGEKMSDLAGISVGGAGDVNGDGYSDMLVGASNNDNGATNAGAAYLVLGPVVGDFKLMNSDAILNGESASGYAYVVDGAGDVNADGYDDVLVGAYAATSGGSATGRAYLIDGPISGTLSLSSADAIFSGEATDDYAGASLAGAGDTDGDGKDDLLIGAYQNDAAGSNAGAAYLILGPGSTRNLSAADAKITGEDADDRLGFGFAAADIDADGYSDVSVGAFYDDLAGASSGSAYLLYGPIAGTLSASAADAQWTGESTRDNAGKALAEGDVDADGFPDLVVAAPSCSSGAGGSGSGRTYVVFGGGY